MNAKLIFVLKLITAVIMLQTLYFKFSAHPESVALFTSIGMEPWGRIGVGVLELIAAVLLFIPKGVWFGALMTVGLMAGAIFFHLTIIGIEGKSGMLFAMAVFALIGGALTLYHEKKEIPFIN